MFVQTNLTTVFLTAAHTEGVLKQIEAGLAGSLKNFVIMDELNLTTAMKKRLSAASESVKYWTLAEVMEAGRKKVQPYAKVGWNDIYTFSYTSGTTSDPKGAMMSHGNLLTMLHANVPLMKVEGECRYVSYLPLAHVYERTIMNFMLCQRAKYAIFNGNVQKLTEDLQILKPTVFASVPRLYSKFYDVIKGKVKPLTGIAKHMYNKALSTKLAKIRYNGKPYHAFWDRLVFGKMKANLGGECQILVTASAPIDCEVLEYLKVCFCAPIVEAYGQTEATGGEFISARYDPIMNHVGGPSNCNEFKLKDVPSMSYTSKDLDSEGRHCPRGEICVRGANVIPGYYKNEEKTKESINSDGWLCSGDIGVILPGSNALKIIDRLKNIFKLSQGEYVAPEKLENVFKMCPTIADIFIYGDSLKSCLVGVINVEEKLYVKNCAEAGITGSFAELCENAEGKKLLMAEIMNWHKEKKLNGIEKPKDFFIDPTPFENHGLLTTTFKIKRNEAKIQYLPILDKMYEKLF